MPDPGKKPILNSRVSLAGLVVTQSMASKRLCARNAYPGEDSSLILSTINRQALDPSAETPGSSPNHFGPWKLNAMHGIVYIDLSELKKADVFKIDKSLKAQEFRYTGMRSGTTYRELQQTVTNS
jgi:hypothetical protein